MAETPYTPSTRDDLLKELRRLERDSNQLITGLVKQVADDNSVANLAEHKLRTTGAEPSPLEILPLKGVTPDEQRAEMRTVLLAGNAPVAYTVIAVVDAGGNVEDEDILLYRPDGGAWAARLAQEAVGIGGFAKKIPWAKGLKSELTFHGLTGGLLASFDNPTGGPDVVVAVTDADIDTDGPGGSKGKDPWWSPNTSLRYVDGTSCNSREFRGVVTPPALRKQYGIAIGDLAWVSLDGKEFGAQVYDSGPENKIGEISFGLAVDLGIYPDRSEATETHAARKGNNVKELVTVFFPRSGGSKAMSAEAIEAGARACIAQWLGTLPSQEKAAFTQAANWPEFFASLQLPNFFNADEVLVKTELSPNTPPPRELWNNIAPTLAVLAKIRVHFNQPLIMHSTYRSLAYNASLSGAAKRSQHLAFRAVDFHVKDVGHSQVAAFARSLRGTTQKVGLDALQMTNTVQGMANPPPFNVEGLNLRAVAGGGTEFTFHGGVAEYDTFVHVDCRGEDSDWG